jgi:uncharacterized protein YjbI with pentapeptide repeats
MLSIWLILGIGAGLVFVMVAGGLCLWWPSRGEPGTQADLGLALMAGALVSAAVLSIQFLIDVRSRQDDHRRAQAAERQSLQISVGQRDLSGIDLSGANMKYFYLAGKRMNGANLAKGRLDNAVLHRATFVGADLDGAWLRDADLTGARFTDATLDGAHLEDAQLYSSDLRDISLEDAHLESAVLTDARISGDLRGADLENAILDNTALKRANLIGADLRGSWLVDADLRNAYLYGANLRGSEQHPGRTQSTLGYARLTGAKYDAKTRWPRTPYAPPQCHRGWCTVTGHAGLHTAIPTFREKIAAHPPHGWRVVPKDQHGTTLLSPKGDAELNVDTLAPGTSPIECAKAYRAILAKYLALWSYERLAGLRIAHRPAVAFRYGFADTAHHAWMAIDIYFAERGLCYRFRGVTSPEVFRLFRDDFARIFGLLGLRRSRAVGHDLPWLVPEQRVPRQAAAAKGGSTSRIRNASDSKR